MTSQSASAGDCPSADTVLSLLEVKNAILRLSGDHLDLEPAVRDALVLDLPFQPLCRPECPGLCVECGFRLADDPAHDHGDKIDERWAGLRSLTEDQTG